LTAHVTGSGISKALHAPWTTPRRLVVFRSLTFVFAALLFFSGETTLGRSRGALQTIARDTAPSIELAEEIGGTFASLDTAVAKALLGNATYRPTAEAAIEKHRLDVTSALVKSAQNITNGDAERAPIGAMIVDFGRYLEKASEAELLHERGEDVAARDAYWAATDLLHVNILSAADHLDTAKKDQMDAAYTSELEANEGAEIVAAGLGLLLLATLLWAKVFLFRRMRRMINVPLGVATVTAFVLTAYLVHAFSDTRENLRIAKRDAFDSIYVLVRARALAHDVEGDKCRSLLAAPGARALLLDSEFKRKVQLLTADPLISKVSTVALNSANPNTRGSRAQDKPKVGGALWDELRNITFPGEYEGAVDMLRAFARYYADLEKVSSLKSIGRPLDAVQVAIGDGSDGATAALSAFDEALWRTLDINQQAFNRSIGLAEAELKRAELLVPGLALLVAIAAWFGIGQRLKEYGA
jgi:hypothetical protein